MNWGRASADNLWGALRMLIDTNTGKLGEAEKDMLEAILERLSPGLNDFEMNCDKIQAIKSVRERLKMPLKDAKDYVERFRSR